MKFKSARQRRKVMAILKAMKAPVLFGERIPNESAFYFGKEIPLNKAQYFNAIFKMDT